MDLHSLDPAQATELIRQAAAVIAGYFETQFGPLPGFDVQRAADAQFNHPWASMYAGIRPNGRGYLSYYRWFIDNRASRNETPRLITGLTHELMHLRQQAIKLAALGLSLPEASQLSDRIEAGLPVPRRMLKYRTWSEGCADLAAILAVERASREPEILVQLAQLTHASEAIDGLQARARMDIGWRLGWSLALLHRAGYLPSVDQQLAPWPFQPTPKDEERLDFALYMINKSDMHYPGPITYYRGLLLVWAALQNGMTLDQLLDTPLSDYQLRRRARGILPPPLALS